MRPLENKISFMDIRQSSAYAEFMRRIGWKVKRVGEWNAFIKPFPFVGSFIKIQRIKKPIPLQEIKDLTKKHRAFKVLVEPDIDTESWKIEDRSWKEEKNPYLPTKTIQIDLTRNEEEIFRQFSEAKRRAIRRAIKQGVKIFESADIDSFISLKSKQMFPLGFLIKNEIKALWNSFHPHNATILLAKHLSNLNCLSEKVAAVFLLFFRKRAYYWLAATTPQGKKLSTPSLLVWEALKLAKKRGCKIFDFEGIYDERFPKTTKSWQGFSKFKKGFGGKIVIYPAPVTLI